MADHSRIEWTEATWNPVTGCSKVSQGCKNCYALRDWPRLAAPRPKPNIYTGRAFTDVRCHSERLDQPLRWTKPRRIFVNSMSDLFHDDVPDAFIDRVFAVMALTSRHTYQVLTKRPERMLDYLSGGIIDEHGVRVGCRRDSIIVDTIRADQANERLPGHGLDGAPWPLENVWLGVSVEDQATANERIPLLLQTPAAVRWVSAEPLLASLDIRPFLFRNRDQNFRVCPQCLYSTNRADFVCPNDGTALQRNDIALDWVVVGGESGPNARPMHPDWARSLRDQCHVYGVPFFFKQWGEWANSANSNDQAAFMSHWMLRDGRVTLIEDDPNDFFDEHGARLIGRVGKKAAGRELDGRTWDEYPADVASALAQPPLVCVKR